MSIDYTLYTRQKQSATFTKSVAQEAVTKNKNLWNDLKLTPAGDPLENKKPEKSFRIVNTLYYGTKR